MPTLPSRVGDLRDSLESPKAKEFCLNAALLVARVALAWVFIYYGSGKLFGWFHGAGIRSTALFFASTAHLHPGTFFAVLSGVAEFVGGIALALGLLGRLAGLALFGDMVIAMITVTFRNGLIGSSLGAGYGLNIALAALSLGVALLGTGRYSLDRYLSAAVRSRQRHSSVEVATSQ